jgi:hypothetical protein
MPNQPPGGDLSLNEVLWAQSMLFPCQPAQARGRARDIAPAQGVIEWYKSDISVKEEEMELRA